MSKLIERVQLVVTVQAQAASPDAVSAGVSRYLENLCERLGLPAAPTVAIEPEESRRGVRIGGRSASLGAPCGSATEDPERMVECVGLALLRHRELLVTSAVASALWEEWGLASSRWSDAFGTFVDLLRECVRHGRSVARLRGSFRRFGPSESAELLVSVLARSGTPQLRFALASEDHARAYAGDGTPRELDGEERTLDEMLGMMSDGLFWELGALFRVTVDADVDLATGFFCLEWNDVITPECRGLPAGKVMTNDNVERLKLLNIDAEATTNPANGRETAFVDAGQRKVCEQSGLTTWGPEAYCVLAISAELRRNAGAYFTTEVCGFFMDQLRSAFPDLVAAAEHRFDRVCLTRVLETLLDEEISIRDLRTILEGLLAVNGVTSADYGKRIVFAPNTGTRYPVRDGRTLDQLRPEELAECARMALRRYVSHKYTRGQNTLIVYLLDPVIEQRLVRATEEPLSEEERERLLAAVRAEVGSMPPSAHNPVILTMIDIRRRVRLLVEHDFPDLAVLSYNELSPDMNIQPIARISLD